MKDLWANQCGGHWLFELIPIKKGTIVNASQTDWL